MKVRLREIFEAREALDRVLTQPMDFKAAYLMRRSARSLVGELQDIENERIRLVEKHADDQTEEEQAQGAPRRVVVHLADFRKDFEEFLALEIELDAAAIPLACLQGLTLSALDLVRLEKFLASDSEGAQDTPGAG